ncbi:hypothetical protein GCM10010517_31660 [Streptosporangium fragile]|uniref:Uncharacterized protein n=1 Tax=Streptosporangium fragile TaxID=46186 RepID=A0ABN3VZV5_9ACTN
MPAGDAADVPHDVWTGVMAQPSPTLPATSQPLGGPFPGLRIASREYGIGGKREELRIGPANGSFTVRVHCSGPLRRVLVWVDGGAPWKQFCGTAPGGDVVVAAREERVTGLSAGNRVVSAAVLPGEVDVEGEDVDGLFTRTEDLFDGWEEQLAGSAGFPLHWVIMVHELVDPVCRDDLRQVDPATGEVVRLRCEGRSAAPSRVP